MAIINKELIATIDKTLCLFKGPMGDMVCTTENGKAGAEVNQTQAKDLIRRSLSDGGSVPSADDVNEAFKHWRSYTTNRTDAAPPKEQDSELYADVLKEVSKHFLLRADSQGLKRYRITSGREVEYITAPELLKRHIADVIMQVAGKQLSSQVIEESKKRFDFYTSSIDYEPLPFTFAGDDRYTFRQLPYVLSPGPIPAIQEFLDRLPNKGETFAAWIGGVFDPKNEGRQLMWLYGVGEDGKSHIMKSVADVLGKAFAPLPTTGVMSRFFGSEVYGKRLAMRADCNDPRYVTSEIVKALTGNDPIRVEYKGRDAFSWTGSVKLVVTANEAPEFSRSRADITRVIPLQVQPNTKGADVMWKANVVKEMPHFLYYCQEMANKHTKNDVIPDIVSEGETEGATAKLAGSSYEDIEVAWKRYWEGAYLFSPELKIAAADMWQPVVDSPMFRDNLFKGKMKKWLTTEKGVEYRKIGNTWYYVGVGTTMDVGNKAAILRARLADMDAERKRIEAELGSVGNEPAYDPEGFHARF